MNMRGVKRKSDDQDELSSVHNKLPKSLRSIVEEENLENGLPYSTWGSSSSAEKSSSSSAVNNEEIGSAKKCSAEIQLIVNRTIVSGSDARAIVGIITNDLSTALGNLREPYDIVPFGSFINGLACRESDLDFFLKMRSKRKSSNDVRSLVNITANHLRKSGTFRAVIRIPTARVPIVKFVHKSTGCECDLSFTNEIGVRNTLLIQYYLSLNENLKPLVLFLKYLLGLYDLHGCQKITTYMVFWLVVYYMQQRNILPAVQNVRDLVPESCIVNGWDCRVPPLSVSPVIDPFLIFTHLTAILKFYSEFKFLSFVISPYLARSLPVDDFENLRIPYSSFAPYFHKVNNMLDTTFNFSVINLQDPTELNINITRQVELQALNKFKSFCYHLYILFTGNEAAKLAFGGSLTEILPKTIFKGHGNVPKDCLQCEIHQLTMNKLAENHPLRQTFTVNGVLFFANQLENIMKSKYKCDVQTIVSDQIVRINRNRGELRRKAVPVAYFRCTLCKEKVAAEEPVDGVTLCAKGESKSELFILMDTTFGGDEIRVRFEGEFGFLRYIDGRAVVNSLLQISK